MLFRTTFFLENSIFLQNKSFRPRKVGKSCSMIELSLIRLGHRFLQYYLFEKRIYSWRAFSSRTLTPTKEFKGKSDTSVCINSLPFQKESILISRIPILAGVASHGIKLFKSILFEVTSHAPRNSLFPQELYLTERLVDPSAFLRSEDSSTTKWFDFLSLIYLVTIFRLVFPAMTLAICSRGDLRCGG